MSRPHADYHTNWTPRLDTRLRKYRAAGLGYREIASLLGVSWRSVCGRARFIKLTNPGHRRWSALDDKQLLTQRRQGWTAKRSAAYLGRTLSAVKYRLTVLLKAKR